MNQPPSPFDDTQPVTPLQTAANLRMRRFFAGLMALAALSLVFTLGLWWASQPSQALATPIAVAFVINGQRTDTLTRARTVADLLRENRVALQPLDALSAPLDATLAPNDVITVATARDVLLTVDGAASTLRTPFTLPYDILRQANALPEENDRVWIDDIEIEAEEVALWPLPATRIRIERALEVTLVDDGERRPLITTADTVGDALFEADITLYLADEVSPDVAETLVDGAEIIITRAQPITVKVGDTTLETRARGGTVRDALAESGVALVGMDYSVPGEDEAVTPGMTITVVRVTEALESTDTPVAFETIYEANPALPLDTRRVRTEGTPGVLRTYERVRYENGAEIAREAAGEELITPPTPRVVEYGTQVVISTITTPDGTFEYWRKLRVYATSYHPAALGGDNVTSIGETLRKGIVGADPTLIPYRTNIYVQGYGVGMIADTGGPRSSPYWIDLGYSDEDFVGWHRYVDIYLLTPVPATINYLLPEWRPLRGTTGY